MSFYCKCISWMCSLLLNVSQSDIVYLYDTFNANAVANNVRILFGLNASRLTSDDIQSSDGLSIKYPFPNSFSSSNTMVFEHLTWTEWSYLCHLSRHNSKFQNLHAKKAKSVQLCLTLDLTQENWRKSIAFKFTATLKKLQNIIFYSDRVNLAFSGRVICEPSLRKTQVIFRLPSQITL